MVLDQIGLSPRRPTAHGGLRISPVYWFVLPALVLVLATAVYPLLSVLGLSLQSPSGTVTIRNYTTALADPSVSNALRNTLVFAVASAALHILLGFVFALLLNQRLRPSFVALARTLLMFPWAMSPVAVAVLWRLFYSPELSPVPPLLSHLGIHTSWNLLGDTSTALAAVIAVNVWFSTPFFMLVILAALQAIPVELYEAARVDGATAAGTVRHVTVPMLAPVGLTLFVFDFVMAFVFYDLVWLMTQGGPVDSTEVLATLIYKVAFQRFDFPYASALAILAFLLMSLVVSVILALSRYE
ncbi:sugar ABC transporter permease [Carboxydochorda subterranea]|uniref:Sugar ABC transporter permease n=1 Tax=Carboxydichorda subterranea TaxID=3109565 RepID=A0ABZ1BU09_9FIRM|nr:sugar ABC transporter permease [Limnochorda sp. L945t]WRP16169.1 sugar ABC transporter permease [Limnochorda sp. L945t]